MITTSLALTHFTSMENLSTEDVMALIERASELKHNSQGNFPQYQSQYICNLFLENSTRTHLSFEVAQTKLGMKVIHFDPASSSINKGETLLDTVITLQALGIETLVIRSKEENYYEALINHPEITASIINGGDGACQHPSQSLLDAMTIYEEFGYFKGLKVGIVGDLLHSRVAKTNVRLLSRLGCQIYFSGPYDWLDEDFYEYGTYMETAELIREVDVLMLLRVQVERHNEGPHLTQEAYHQQYGLTMKAAETMKDHAIIMHPAPVNRDVEIASDLVLGGQSRIVTQMENGVYARMAILEAIMNGKGQQRDHY